MESDSGRVMATSVEIADRRRAVCAPRSKSSAQEGSRHPAEPFSLNPELAPAAEGRSGAGDAWIP